MSRRSGFTLIELLAGLVLTGLLTAALFQVVNAVVRSDRRLAADPPRVVSPWEETLRRHLQADLDRALAVRVKRDVIEIEGWCGRDPADLTDHHRPVRVAYRLVDGRALIREQWDMDNARIRRPARELVAVGIGGWDVSLTGSLLIRRTDRDRPAIALVLPEFFRQGAG